MTLRYDVLPQRQEEAYFLDTYFEKEMLIDQVVRTSIPLPVEPAFFQSFVARVVDAIIHFYQENAKEVVIMRFCNPYYCLVRDAVDCNDCYRS